jgi:hypothetical protein
LDGLVFTEITADQNVDLFKPFSSEEIEEVVRCCDGSKNMGSDGFNFAFFKVF